MFRRVPCDWFLTDGIIPRLRLDAPEYVNGALLTAGILNPEGSYWDKLKDEWIYRRKWVYSSEFAVQASEGRRFMRLTGLSGEYKAYLNGEELPLTGTPSAECELTGRCADINRIEIVFEPDKEFSLHPQLGFSGMLMLRETGIAAINGFSVSESGEAYAGVDLNLASAVEISYTQFVGDTSQSRSFIEDLDAGFTPLHHTPFAHIAEDTRIDICVTLSVKGKLSDEARISLYEPSGSAQPRGFVTNVEGLMGLAKKAGANSVFTPDAEPDSLCRVLASRHKLACLTQEAGGVLPVSAPCALMPYDALMEIAGREDALNTDALWLLTGAERKVFDACMEQVGNGDVKRAIALSRCMQAESVRAGALAARLDDRPFALKDVEAKTYAPASPALFDADNRPRPAYFALVNAWRSVIAFTRTGKISEDGIFSSEVFCLSDSTDDEIRAVKVSAYGLDGRLISTSSYAVAPRIKAAGRFICELPKEGCVIIRTSLTESGRETPVYTEIVTAEDVKTESLPETQLLVTESGVTNVGASAAFHVCVPEARFYGCILPGENIVCEKPYEPEGLNIYF